MERIFTNDKSIVMSNKKIKVVWICYVSNQQIREKLNYYKWTPIALIRKALGKIIFSDYGKWNSNAIKEFEKIDDIDLHIISPHMYISYLHEFVINNVSYHIINSEDDNFMEIIRTRLLKKRRTNYNKNAKKINKLVEKINPDIVHMIGVEIPFYGEAGLLLSEKRPFIINLQTLVNDPDFLNNYFIGKEKYEYLAKLEEKLIKKADYIGTKIDFFRNIILQKIKPNAKFLDISLAVGEDITISNYKKEYDFVYFAVNISKAVDWALEAFAIAKQQYPNITLHVVGGYSSDLMSNIKNRMQELGLGNEVDFTGLMPTHDDVIEEVRKARFALLPLKIDQISGTVREAMSNGLPVVTTITPATPKLNEKRESVLLSEKEDFKAMADNMCKLLSDANYAKQIQQNAAQTIYERYSNETAMKEWRERYYEILKK